MNNTILQANLHHYLVSGIIQSNIAQDGGLLCYQEIPFKYHAVFVIILSLIHVFFFLKWKKQLSYTIKEVPPSRFEIILGMIFLLSWILTLYSKIKTRKALFMFNPCHLTILAQIYLLMSKNSKKHIEIYTAWTGWLFGAYLAILVPHLQGIDIFQILIYYFEHISIMPLGYLALSKRYGFKKPDFRDQLAAFSTIALYQFLILVPLSRAYMVNLNFALCHSPADPIFPVIGYYYFVAFTLILNILSYLFRWFSYAQIRIFYAILSPLGIKDPQIYCNSEEAMLKSGKNQ